MIAWLTSLTWPVFANFFWHGIKRFSSVILIFMLIVTPIVALHQFGNRHESLGYKKGYAEAIRDNPPQTFGTVGQVINQKCPTIKSLALNILGLHVGAWFERK